ncbi:MAG TPA: hypothetical protein VFU81_08805, partial [Thermomicrobiales bacterium]|nr:hypothetical protein [Thermomicrobiales bacterium]
ELDADARVLDEGPRFAAVCDPARLRALWSAAGFAATAIRAIDIETRFRDFDDYWLPFLGGQGPAPAYLASLAPERQTALRERVRARLPEAADGLIALLARAWAVRGRRDSSGR